MSFIETFPLLVSLIAMADRRVSARCLDEFLIPAADIHVFPEEHKTTETTVYDPSLLYGDKVTVVDITGYVIIGVRSEESPVKFADRILTEVTVRIEGVTYANIGFVQKSSGLFNRLKEMPVPSDGILRVDLNGIKTDEMAVRVYKHSATKDFSVSHMILKACVEDKPDVNDCTPDSCKNGGTCKDEINSFTCRCAAGFDGPTCENNINDCRPDSCLNGGTCKDVVTGFTCQCAEGFDGPTCANNINDCEPDSCLNGGICKDGINSFICQCAEGFDGPTCENNIDDCTPDSCQYGGTCKDGINSFTCQCIEGLAGPTCEINIDDCKPDSCLNGGTCYDKINSFTCQCAEGFDGPTCDNNINDCKPDSCQNGGTCKDKINSFKCQCAEGFDGPFCDNNIDECKSLPCKNGGTCVDGINDFFCECVSGYSGKTCETAPRCKTFKCISNDCGYSECTMEKATKITKVTLKESVNKKPCYYYGYPAPGKYQSGDPGYFGYKDNLVWVDNGCKAIFEVCYE